jgi:PPOX class probable F420-dependent enzyme
MTEAAFHDQLDRQEQRGATVPAFPCKYLSVTTYRRDGTGVATPVWFVQEGGRLLIETDASSYKVRRIRRNPCVTVAPCTATGRLRGAVVPARAQLLPDTDVTRVERLMARKYRVDLLVIKPIRTLQAALHRGRPRGKPAVLAITPD